MARFATALLAVSLMATACSGSSDDPVAAQTAYWRYATEERDVDFVSLDRFLSSYRTEDPDSDFAWGKGCDAEPEAAANGWIAINEASPGGDPLAEVGRTYFECGPDYAEDFTYGLFETSFAISVVEEEFPTMAKILELENS